ncbi:DbpA RNA binding domain-containing protein [Roseisolibacter agri]|uniref:DbpA RNA binding domain-containing protein n=1 Tax=Roseisolibacter agri TaxID=2014610 RepID=UPI0024E0EDC1|nr:DbpA RNA binding domain-containing protein [Roseisolibacter agri]
MDQDERDAGLGAGQTGGAAGAPGTTGTTPAGEAQAATTRSQHVVYTLPHDWGTIPQFLGSALERLEADAPETQLVIVTPDAETALAVADAALALRDAGRGTARSGEASPVLAVTRVDRAVRQLKARPAAAIAADPAALTALIRASALKLDTVRTLVLAWADDILDSPDAEELDAVLTEVPKEAARTLVAATMTDDVEALIERALRRPRRIAPPAAATPAPFAVSYVATAPSARPATLRRVLDELDPATATVIVASGTSEAEARRAVRALGYAVPTADAIDDATDDDAIAAAQRALGTPTANTGPQVRIVRADDAAPLPTQQALVVLYDLPTSREERDRVAAARAVQLVALLQPRQLPALRALAGGAVRPLVLRDLGRREEARDTALRAELRAEVQRGLPARELRVLEELLETHDGVELAAAALRLLERERARRLSATAAPTQAAGAAAPAAGAPASGMTKLFITVGTRDNVRPGDLVGAISNEAGITSERIGKIELRESFALVEVASADAERVIEKVNGIMIRGRKAAVRAERETRPERGGDRGGPRERRDGGERRGPERRTFGDRPERGPRPGGAGGSGGPRGRTFDAQRDGPRGFGAADDRPVRERAEQRGEWAERAERLQRAKRRAPGAPDTGASDAGAPDAGGADLET